MISSRRYTVVVSNVGTVYNGDDPILAVQTCNRYVRTSKSPYGCVSGKDVTLFVNGEIRKKYCAPNSSRYEDFMNQEFSRDDDDNA